MKEGAPERVRGGAGHVDGLGIVPPAIPGPIAVHRVVLPKLEARNVLGNSWRDEEGAQQE